MRATLRRLLVTVALLGLAAAAACSGSSSAAILPDGEGGVYVALGDSFAAGDGASDPATTSYVALVGEELRGLYGDGLEVRNLAVGGATTQSLIDDQLQAALDLLATGDVVRLVTVTIGGNDLNALGASEVCQHDPADPECPIADILAGIEQRLDGTLVQLRRAAPDTPIVMELYPNIFSGTGHMFERPAETAFGMLNAVIEDVTARNGVILADPRRPFTGNGRDLTHLLDPTPDPHPNDDGHRAIARAFLDSVGLSLGE